MLKVVTGAESDDDCYRIHKVGATLNKPYIGVCLGPQGSLSRVLNKRFTPVTHPLMATAAPGQLSVEQLMKARIERGLVIPKEYYLFGTPIQQSLSPAMHNAAYNQRRLPHHYSLNEQTDYTQYLPLLLPPTPPTDTTDTNTNTNTTIYDILLQQYQSFGGASVTIPYKEVLLPYLDEVRSPADVIGAINTIAVETVGGEGVSSISSSTDSAQCIANSSSGGGSDGVNGSGGKRRRLIGYNTDWLGIYNNVLKKLSMAWGVDSWEGQVGLVVGAG